MIRAFGHGHAVLIKFFRLLRGKAMSGKGVGF